MPVYAATCLPMAMRAVRTAIELDDAGKVREAYCGYLSSMLFVIKNLKDDAWNHDFANVCSQDTIKLLKLVEHCHERASDLVSSFQKSEPKQDAKSCSPPSNILSNETSQNETIGSWNVIPRGTANLSMSNPIPKTTSAASGKIEQLINSLPTPPKKDWSTNSKPSRRVSSVDGIQNQQMFQAYQRRRSQIHQKYRADYNLGLFRKTVEDMAIEKARRKILNQKLEERRERLRLKAEERFSTKTGSRATDAAYEKKIYTKILEFEHETAWPQKLRENLRSDPENTQLIEDIVVTVLSAKEHPLGQQMAEMQYALYRELSFIVANFSCPVFNLCEEKNRERNCDWKTNDKKGKQDTERCEDFVINFESKAEAYDKDNLQDMVKTSKLEFEVKKDDDSEKEGHIFNEIRISPDNGSNTRDGEMPDASNTVSDAEAIEDEPKSNQSIDLSYGPNSAELSDFHEDVSADSIRTSSEAFESAFHEFEEYMMENLESDEFELLPGNNSLAPNNNIDIDSNSEMPNAAGNSHDDHNCVEELDEAEKEGSGDSLENEKVDFDVEEAEDKPEVPRGKEGEKDFSESFADNEYGLKDDVINCVASEDGENRENIVNAESRENEYLESREFVSDVEAIGDSDDFVDLKICRLNQSREAEDIVVRKQNRDDREDDSKECVNVTADQPMRNDSMKSASMIGDEEGFTESNEETCGLKAELKIGHNELNSSDMPKEDLEEPLSADQSDVWVNLRAEGTCDGDESTDKNDKFDRDSFGISFTGETSESCVDKFESLDSTRTSSKENMGEVVMREVSEDNSSNDFEIFENDEKISENEDGTDGVSKSESSVTGDKDGSNTPEIVGAKMDAESVAENIVKETDKIDDVGEQDGGHNGLCGNVTGDLMGDHLQRYINDSVDYVELKNKIEKVVKEIHTSLSKLHSLLIVTYDELDLPIGRDQSYAAVESLFFKPLWQWVNLAFRRLNVRKEITLFDVIKRRRNCCPLDFFVREKYALIETEGCASENDYPYKVAVEELRKITSLSSPLEKLECLVSTSKLICQSVADYWKRKGESTPPSVGCDDLLPILTYVIVKTSLPQLVSECHAMEEFIHESYLLGEEGYCLTTLSTAIAYSLNLRSGTMPGESFS